jgi:hypothetical protein
MTVDQLSFDGGPTVDDHSAKDDVYCNNWTAVHCVVVNRHKERYDNYIGTHAPTRIAPVQPLQQRMQCPLVNRLANIDDNDDDCATTTVSTARNFRALIKIAILEEP